MIRDSISMFLATGVTGAVIGTMNFFTFSGSSTACWSCGSPTTPAEDPVVRIMPCRGTVPLLVRMIMDDISSFESHDCLVGQGLDLYSGSSLPESFDRCLSGVRVYIDHADHELVLEFPVAS